MFLVTVRLALVANEDPESRQTWSGTPSGLIAGFRSLQVETIGISVQAPSKLERLVRERRVPERHAARIRSLVARRKLKSLSDHFILQMGSTFLLPDGYCVASFDDLTIVQHERFQDAWLCSFSDPDRRAWRSRQAEIYRRSKVCLTATEFARRSIIEDFGVNPARVVAVGLGHNVAYSATSRSWEHPRFLMVAADWKRKNVPLTLQVFGKLLAHHPTARLDVVGGYDGPSQPGVTNHGWLEPGDPRQRRKLSELYSRATCFVMPSRLEAFGIAYVEAAASGIPSIGTIYGGAAEAIGPSGVVVDPDSPDELLQAMSRFCDPLEAQAFGRKGPGHAEHFTWPAVTRRILAAGGLGPGGSAPDPG